MVRSMIFRALGLLAAASITAPVAWAQDLIDPERPYDCTLENVAGAFGFNQDLVRAASTGRPAATIGILDLAPDGTFELQFEAFVEVGGEPVTSRIYQGEWSVEANCFGFADFQATQSTLGPVVEIDFKFVAVDNATELFLIRNDPLEEGDAKLLFRR